MTAPRQRILLHVCCAPCATHSIEKLGATYDVTLFFSNSNIHPRDEYETRLAQARKLADLTGCRLIEDAYDHAAWLAFIAGFEAEPEKGRRCLKCFEYNLARAAQCARRNGFDGFTTTLTISPHKRSPDIFRVGAGLGDFLAVDFKKRDGFRRSIELSRQYGLYRQAYCGCEFSRRTAPGDEAS
jgi:hypothetical protein